MKTHTEDFSPEAVRIALTSGLPRRRVAADLGVGYGLQPSMSGRGNCYDNASVETFFKSLKAELIWRQKWQTRRQTEAAIGQYINGIYNTRRRHSYLGGISPLAFEAKVA